MSTGQEREFRERLHAVRAELDSLQAEAEAARREDRLFGPPFAVGCHLYRARVAVTSADKEVAKAEDPRSPSGLAPLKRIVRRRGEARG